MAEVERTKEETKILEQAGLSGAATLREARIALPLILTVNQTPTISSMQRTPISNKARTT